jgi:hypothetical protein
MDAAIGHVDAVDDGIPYRSAALDDPPAHVSPIGQATLLDVVRCAMTLPLPHFRQRKRLTN